MMQRLVKQLFRTPRSGSLSTHANMAGIPNDVREFLRHYPGGVDDEGLRANMGFYMNTTRCRPDGLLIEEFHDKWYGDYNKLEAKHGFIQWLFPIREHGMNFESQPLQPHEIAAIKADPVALGRLLISYKLILDFYGMRLISEETGAVDRALPPRNYAPRYENLVYSSHNYLRISRILKCLSEFGFERLNAGFLLHVLNEQSESQELDAPRLRASMDRWWANCIRNEEEREWVGRLIERVRTEQGYVFTREMYAAALEHRRSMGSFRNEDMPLAS